MEVGGIQAPGSASSSNLLKQWQLGERLLVKVVQITSEGVGTIQVKGQVVSALLDPSTKVGDQFWVKVGNFSEGSLMLVRQPSVEKQGEIQLAMPQFKQVTERGLPINQEIVALIKAFPTEKPGVLATLLTNLQGTPFDGLITNLKKSSPKWEGLSEENGAEVLLECLRKLGLDYEQRIQQLMKLDPQAKEVEKNSLKETFKSTLLGALQNLEGLEDHASYETVTKLLQRLTGQQLWLKTGALDNAYLLLHLPIFNQEELIPVQIAIESARKGGKMDEQHCRVGLQMETQQLGQVGIDAFFYGDSLTMRVLTHDPQSLPQLLEEILPEVTTQFAKLGINLSNLETGDLNQNLEFQSFLQGAKRSGVDIQK